MVSICNAEWAHYGGQSGHEVLLLNLLINEEKNAQIRKALDRFSDIDVAFAIRTLNS